MNGLTYLGHPSGADRIRTRAGSRLLSLATFDVPRKPTLRKGYLRVAHAADDRHHDVRRGSELGRLDRAGGLHAARLRPRRGAGRRAAAARAAERRLRSRRRSTSSTGSSSRGAAISTPSTYGADPHPETTGIVTERDRGELALLQAALARDMPVLGRLPREPGAERRSRRRPRPASARDRRARPAPAHGADDGRPRGDREARLAARRDPRRASAGQVVAPPGLRPARRGSPRGGVGRGRNGRGARGSDAGASRSACSGIPRRARTSPSSPRSSSRRAEYRSATRGSLSTILPSCSPASMRSWAARASASGKTSSTIGRALPLATSS